MPESRPQLAAAHPAIAHPLARAFTLIELLVVVAIISILASMLLPTLGQARNAARGSVCQANLKQIYIGYHTYAEEFDDYLPNSRYYSDGWQTKIGNTGIWGAKTYLDRIHQDYVSVFGSAFWREGYAVLECPSEEQTFQVTSGAHAGSSWTRYRHTYHRSSYSQNFTISQGVYTRVRKGFSTGPFYQQFGLSEAILNGDASRSPTLTYFYTEMNTVNVNSLHAFRHNGKTANFVYWDGHVAPITIGTPVYSHYYPGPPPAY